MSKKRDGFGHEKQYEGETNDWITPKWIVDAFDGLAAPGRRYFDLDPCASLTQPWTCAQRQFTVKDNGLALPWSGNVWLNPPYGPWAKFWIGKLAAHRKGVALIYARTGNGWWHRDIFPSADGFLFIRGRVEFNLPDGSLPPRGGGGGADSALIAWGDRNYRTLIKLCDDGTIPGAFCPRALYTGSVTS